MRDGPYHWTETIFPLIGFSVFLFVVVFFIWLGFYSVSIGGPWQDALQLSSCGGVLFGLGIFFMLRRIIRVWRSIRNLSQNFTLTDAVVVDRTIGREHVAYGTAVDVYYVIVRFQPGTLDGHNEDFILQGKVSSKIFESVENGQTIGIKYANNNPLLALFEWEFSS